MIALAQVIQLNEMLQVWESHDQTAVSLGCVLEDPLFQQSCFLRAAASACIDWTESEEMFVWAWPITDTPPDAKN